MAATGYTAIQHYRTTTASAAPVAGNLAAGELAINTLDEKLYFKNSAGVVKLLASVSATAFNPLAPGPIGSTTPSTGAFTTLTATGTTTLATSLTGLAKLTAGVVSAAAAGTDYQAPIGTISGLAKGNGANALTAAVVRTDYAEPTTALATGILKNTTTTGAHSIATAGTDYVAPVGSDGQLTRQMLIDCGMTYLDKGNSGTTAQTLDYTAGSHQKLTVTGAFTMNAPSNWPPTGNLGELLLELANGGSQTITWPTINWIQQSGVVTTSMSTYLAGNSGRTALQTSGTDFILLWSRDAGTTVYGKLV